MTTTYHTAIATGESNAPSTINTRLAALDAAIAARAAEITSLNTSGVGSVYAQINNASGEGDTSWAVDNISGTFLAGATVVYTVSGVVYASTVAANTSSSPLTVSAAPGVTIPDNTVISQVPAGVAAKMLEGTYNVKDPVWGATGDGSTDDQVAIQAAIDACNTAGGGVVIMPPGTYVIGATLRPKSNVIVQGAGIGRTVIERASGYTSYLWLTTTTVTNFAIKDLTLDGTTAASGSPLVDIRNSYGLTFERVRFDTALYYLLALDGCHDGSATYQNRIIDCEFENAAATGSVGAGLELCITNGSGTVGTSNVFVRGCKFANLTGLGVCGIRVSQSKSGSSGGSNITITDCQFDSTVYDTAIGVFGADVDGLKIANCESQTGLANYYLLAKNALGLKNVQVTNCRATSATDQGLSLGGVDGFTVSNCIFTGCGFEGLDILNSRCGTVTGCTITDNCTTSTAGRLGGIRMSYAFTENTDYNKDITIANNTITDTRAYASKTQEIGVDIRTKAEDITIANNYLRGNKTSSIAERNGSTYGYHNSLFFSGNICDDRPAHPSGINLLTGAGFATWSSGTSASPDGWNTTDMGTGGTGTVAQEASIVKFGTYAVKLTQTSFTTGHQRFFRPSSDLNLDANDDYVFSVWVYIPSGAATPTTVFAGTELIGPSAGAPVNQFAPRAYADINIVDQWQLVKFRFNTGSDGVGRPWVGLDAAASDGTNDYIIISGPKLERGSAPTAFSA